MSVDSIRSGFKVRRHFKHSPSLFDTYSTLSLSLSFSLSHSIHSQVFSLPLSRSHLISFPLTFIPLLDSLIPYTTLSLPSLFLPHSLSLSLFLLHSLTPFLFPQFPRYFIFNEWMAAASISLLTQSSSLSLSAISIFFLSKSEKLCD